MLERGGLVRLIYDPLSLLLVHFSNRSYTVSAAWLFHSFAVRLVCPFSLTSVGHLSTSHSFGSHSLEHTRWNTHSLEHPR